MAAAKRQRRRSRPRQAGVAAIEFVFVFPVLLLLFFGLVNFSHYISTSQRIAQGAVVAADIVSRVQDMVTASNFTDAFTAAELAITPLPIANVRIDIYNYSGTLAALRWKKSSPNGPNCTAPDPTVDPIRTMLTPIAPATATPDVIVVVACMTYAAPVPEFPGLREIFNNLVIRRSVNLRPRDTARLDCAAC